MSLEKEFSFDYLSTPLGVLVYYWDQLGISHVELRARAPRGKSRPFFDLTHQLVAHFQGLSTDFSHYPLNLRGYTPFELAVYDAVRAIPYGKTLSYQQVAEMVGSPKAYQAVGQALKKNPLPIIIPCHRVKETQKLGGYSFGQGSCDKRYLMELERGQQFLFDTV